LKKFAKNLVICLVILFAFTVIGMTFVFPSKYDQLIKAQCKKYDVDENLVRAVIWTESKFDKKAISNKGAVGLMQLLPSTAYYIASLIGEEIEYADLFRADVSIKLGVFYLRLLLDKFKNVDNALCAYNAGEGNVSKWLSEGKGIPFKETRDYLKRVLSVKKIYELKNGIFIF